MDLTLTGEVLEVDQPNALAFTWGEDTLRFELLAEGGGTRLVLIDEPPVKRPRRSPLAGGVQSTGGRPSYPPRPDLAQGVGGMGEQATGIGPRLPVQEENSEKCQAA
jgi:hypothetical protein